MDLGANLLQSFGKDKLIQHYYSDALAKNINDASGHIGGDWTANQADLAKFNAANAGAIAQKNALDTENIGRYRGLISNAASFDPLSQYKAIGDYKLGALKGLASGLADQGRASQSLDFARLGYGRGGSSYMNQALIDRLTRQLAPVYAGVLSGIGGDSALLSDQSIHHAALADSLIKQQGDLPGRTAQMWLNPIYARGDISGQEQGSISNLLDSVRKNTAGFTTERDTIGKIGDALVTTGNNIEDTAKWAANTALSAYTGGMMGGGGGGGGKGGGGGIMSLLKNFTGGQPAASNFQTGGYQIPPQATAPAYLPQSPGASYGGFNYGSPSANPAWLSGYTDNYGPTQQYRPGL